MKELTQTNTQPLLHEHGVSSSLCIEFLEWAERGMWSKFESRPKNEYVEMEGWSNTHNYTAMKQPLSSKQLFELFFVGTFNQ